MTGDGFVVTNLSIAGGELVANVNVRSGGAFNWSGGTLTGSVNVPAGALFNLSGVTKFLSLNSSLVIGGNTTWTSGDIQSAFGSALTNNGVFTVQCDASYLNNSIGYGNGLSVPLFVNNGSFVKTASAGTTTFNNAFGGMAFNNNGTVNVQTGTLALGGGGTAMNDSFTAASGAMVDFFDGAYFFNSNFTMAGAGAKRISGASVTFNNVTNAATGPSGVSENCQAVGCHT